MSMKNEDHFISAVDLATAMLEYAEKNGDVPVMVMNQHGLAAPINELAVINVRISEDTKHKCLLVISTESPTISELEDATNNAAMGMLN